MVNSLFLAATEMHWALVCLIGISVVFAGLAIIIGLVELMNFVTNKAQSKKKSEAPENASAPVASAPSAVIENRDELVVAACAAIAEESGADISAIRVVSFKKV